MENNQTELTAKEVLENVSLMHSIETGEHLYHHWLVSERNTLKLALSAMREYADLQTASLQAEKAELLEALGNIKRICGDIQIGFKTKSLQAWEIADALLSKHTK